MIIDGMIMDDNHTFFISFLAIADNLRNTHNMHNYLNSFGDNLQL